MFQKRVFIVIAVVLTASQLMAQLVLSIGVKKGELASTVSRLKDFGKLIETDETYSIIRMSLKNGASTAIATIRKDKSVLFVRNGIALSHFEDGNLNSLSLVNSTLAEMTGRNIDREKMAKILGLPPLEKMDKIKTGYYEAYRYWLEERAYPNNRVNYKAYEEGVLQRDQMPPAYGRLGDSLGTMQ